jgi:hypothetical protein
MKQSESSSESSKALPYFILHVWSTQNGHDGTSNSERDESVWKDALAAENDMEMSFQSTARDSANSFLAHGSDPLAEFFESDVGESQHPSIGFCRDCRPKQVLSD